MITAQYAAGFFDGEGTVDIRHRKTNGGKYVRFELRVSATQKDAKVLLHLAERYGGTVGQAGAVHRWLAASQAADRFLCDVFPYLVVKRDEVAIAMKFYGEGEWGRKHDAPGRGVAKTSASENMRRLSVMAELRSLREQKGFAKQNRKPLPKIAHA